MLQSNSSVGVVNTDRNETSSYSKGQSVYSSGSSYSGKATGSSAARRGDEGMDMSEYMELVIAKNICRLAEMKQQDKELDKNILNGTIDNIIALYGHHDRKSAYRLIMESIETMIANNTI